MKNIIKLFIAVSFFGACKSKTTITSQIPTETETNVVTLTAAQMKYVDIETGEAENRQISSTLKVQGKIDVPPQNMISVSLPLGGYLKTTKLLPGMHVRKHEIIAVVEDNQFIQLQQDYLTARAQLALQEAEFFRQKELNATKASSDKVYEQAAAGFETQKILTRSLAEKLKLIGINPLNLTLQNISKSINVYSPIDGFVKKVNVNIGKYVTPGDVLFELVNPTDIHLSLRVFEKDLKKIFIGQPVVSYTNSNPDKKYPGDIILISKDVSADGMTEVHCHFDKYDGSLIPGMYMNADIELKNHLSNVLPEDAVVRFEGKEYIFESKGRNTFEMLPVQTGSIHAGYIEIVNDASLLGKSIVTRGAYTLLMTLKNREEE